MGPVVEKTGGKSIPLGRKVKRCIIMMIWVRRRVDSPVDVNVSDKILSPFSGLTSSSSLPWKPQVSET
jgi:hypothetical protein